MIQVNLGQLKTNDGIYLDGIFTDSKGKDMALIWIHGLSSKFYGDQTLIQELSMVCQKNNIGYFKFNTRGRDIVYRAIAQ